jgi:hypothetical protein
MVNCSVCGKELKEGVRFCIHCGTPAPAAAPQAAATPPSPPAAVPATVACPVCGGNLPPNVKFCIKCGTPVSATPPIAEATPQPPAATPPIVASCAVCGSGLPPNVKFCIKCGTPIAAIPPAPPAPPPPSPSLQPPPPRTTASVPVTPPPLPPVSFQPPGPPPQPSPYQPPPPHGGIPTPASRSPLPLIIGVLVIVFTGAGGWFGYQYWQKGRAEAPPVVETRQPEPVQTAQTPLPEPESILDQSPPPESSAPESVPLLPPVQPPVTRPVTTPPEVRTQPQAQTQTTPAPATVQPDLAPAPPVQSTPVQAAPAQPAPSRTPVFQPERSYPPERPAAPVQPRYSGPNSGVIVWSGQLERGAAVQIDGDRPSTGSINGALPGVPVIVEITPSDIAVAEAPGPGNDWKRISIRSRKNRHSVVTIRWRIL